MWKYKTIDTGMAYPNKLSNELISQKRGLGWTFSLEESHWNENCELPSGTLFLEKQCFKAIFHHSVRLKANFIHLNSIGIKVEISEEGVSNMNK